MIEGRSIKTSYTSAIAIAFIVAAGFACKETASLSDPTTGMQISAGSLIGEYRENEVAADERYKGRALAVTGIVDTIGKDIVDNMYVTLGGSKDSEIGSVQCIFSDKHKHELSQLRKGQIVRVVGICKGKMIGNVLLRQCSVRP